MEEHTIEITMVSVTINLVLGVKGTGHNEHLSEIYFEIYLLLCTALQNVVSREVGFNT